MILANLETPSTPGARNSKKTWPTRREPQSRRRASCSMPSLRCVCPPGLAVKSRIEADSSRVGSGHQSPGLWRHPEDESWRFNEISHWVELAKLLEEAKFHGIFIADVLGGFDLSFRGSNSKNQLTRSRRLRCLLAVPRPRKGFRCPMARQRAIGPRGCHGRGNEEHRLRRDGIDDI